jgi:nucleoside-diphosphate-sugar epimerase
VRAFVSGAGGFIGSAVVRALAARGDDVIAHVGPPGCGLHAPPEALASLELDIVDAGDLAPLLRNCDAVVHLAGPAAVVPSFADAEGYLRAHALGTAALAGAAKTAGVRRFVHVSSAEIYGRADAERVREDAPARPRSPYAVAKLAAEAAVGAAARTGGPSAVVLRPFSVYGPGQRASSLLATIVSHVLAGDVVELRDLAPVRDYVHVHDVARAAVLACDAVVDEVETVNVGTGVGTSVAALVGTVFDALGRSGGVRELGAQRGAAEIFRLVADPSHADAVLGWRAAISLREGIAALPHHAAA